MERLVGLDEHTFRVKLSILQLLYRAFIPVSIGTEGACKNPPVNEQQSYDPNNVLHFYASPCNLYDAFCIRRNANGAMAKIIEP